MDHRNDLQGDFLWFFVLRVFFFFFIFAKHTFVLTKEPSGNYIFRNIFYTIGDLYGCTNTYV